MCIWFRTVTYIRIYFKYGNREGDLWVNLILALCEIGYVLQHFVCGGNVCNVMCA